MAKALGARSNQSDAAPQFRSEVNERSQLKMQQLLIIHHAEEVYLPKRSRASSTQKTDDVIKTVFEDSLFHLLDNVPEMKVILTSRVPLTFQSSSPVQQKGSKGGCGSAMQ